MAWMNTGFLSFNIKAVAKKPKKEKKPTSASLITGIIEKSEEYDYLVKVVSIKDNKTEELFYRLTDKSYSLYDKTVIYSRKKNKKTGYTCIIKTHNDAKLYFEGKNPLYVPFKPGIKVKGMLVTENGNKLFDIIEVCNPECYVSY